MKLIRYASIDGNSNGYWGLMALFAAFILAALGSSYFMEHNGHWVTGMNNQIVWGLPHVFAVFLIVAASGALNVASIASVFNKKANRITDLFNVYFSFKWSCHVLLFKMFCRLSFIF